LSAFSLLNGLHQLCLDQENKESLSQTYWFLRINLPPQHHSIRQKSTVSLLVN